MSDTRHADAQRLTLTVRTRNINAQSELHGDVSSQQHRQRFQHAMPAEARAITIVTIHVVAMACSVTS